MLRKNSVESGVRYKGRVERMENKVPFGVSEVPPEVFFSDWVLGPNWSVRFFWRLFLGEVLFSWVGSASAGPLYICTGEGVSCDDLTRGLWQGEN